MTTTSVSARRLAEAAEHAVDAVGVGVVEEVRRHPVAGARRARRPRAAARAPSRRCRRPARGGSARRAAASTRPSCTRAAKSRTRDRASADRGRDLRRRAPSPGRAASSGRPCASRRGWRSPRASSASMASSARLHRRLSPREGPVRESPRGSGRAATRARGRRTAASCSAPRAPVASWRLLVVRDGILPPAARPRIAERAPEAAHWRWRPPRMTPRLALVLLAGLTLSCGGGGSSPTSPSTGGSAGTTSCTTLGQCTFVRDALRDYYYWYKELPEPRPGLLLLARGLPRRRALPAARLELQLRHVQGRERRLLLGQPVHRLRPLLQADGRHRAAPRAGLPRQPGRRRGDGPRATTSSPSTARRWPTSSGPARSTPSSGPSRRA